MNKMIFLNGDGRRTLERDFSVTRQTLWAALNYRTKSGRAKMLRAAALQRGGVLVDLDDKPTSEPNFTTYFDEVPYRMVQVFSKRVKLICDLEDKGDVSIWVDGEEAVNLGVLPINKLPMAQAQAQTIVNGLK
ncbi:MAG: hypothetical protein SNH41_06680 [Rikenellaceae bacterium]